MKSKLVLLLVAAGALGSGVAVHAHHSFNGTYFVDREITIEGEVVQFLRRNPHSFIHVEGQVENEPVQVWSIEGGSANQLTDDEGNTLNLGDHVVVVANPARSVGAQRGRLVTITRPSDGWTWGGRDGQIVD